MNKGILIFLIIFVLLVGIGFFVFIGDRDMYIDDDTDLVDETLVPANIEYLNEGTILRLVNQDGLGLAEYTIEDFNVWVEENWNEFFETRPAFGEAREVSFGDFSWFDRTAALSPQGDILAFSVHDYAVATSISFVGVIEIGSNFAGLVGDESAGDIEQIIWSPGGSNIAYILHTARVRGDGLSVDNIRTLSKEFSLDGSDIIETLGLEDQVEWQEFLPNFDNIVWINNNSLEFTTDSPVEEDVSMRWSVDSDGSNLQQI